MCLFLTDVSHGIIPIYLFRLGHREQKDEWVPRLVEVFQRHNVLPPDAIISAGSVSSACTAGLFCFFQIKSNLTIIVSSLIEL